MHEYLAILAQLLCCAKISLCAGAYMGHSHFAEYLTYLGLGGAAELTSWVPVGHILRPF